MSWSASFDIVPGVGYENEQTSGLNTPEHNLQYEAARNAVAAITGTGALGGPTYRYRVILSGHGNPDNKPTPGWANDFVSIQIVQQHVRVVQQQ